jgi:uncharacterized protein YbjT (DUF2867 family)
LAGTDPWLRAALSAQLDRADLKLSNIGTGSASLRGIDTLVFAPSITPLSGDPAKDIGASPAAMTFASAVESGVRRGVLVSRVGGDAGDPESYLSQLGLMERKAVSALGKVTVIRVTHPFGPVTSPGPLLGRLLQHVRAMPDGRDGLPDTRVQPVFVGDVVDLVLEAVAGRIGPGVVELGGPDTMSLADFAGHASLSGAATQPRRGLSAFLTSRRRRRVLSQFLAHDSVASPRFASPRALRTRSLEDVWTTSDLGEER